MATFPPPPVNTIDWSNVGFRVREGEFLLFVFLFLSIDLGSSYLLGSCCFCRVTELRSEARELAGWRVWFGAWTLELAKPGVRSFQLAC